MKGFIYHVTSKDMGRDIKLYTAILGTEPVSVVSMTRASALSSGEGYDDLTDEEKKILSNAYMRLSKAENREIALAIFKIPTGFYFIQNSLGFGMTVDKYIRAFGDDYQIIRLQYGTPNSSIIFIDDIEGARKRLTDGGYKLLAKRSRINEMMHSDAPSTLSVISNDGITEIKTLDEYRPGVGGGYAPYYVGRPGMNDDFYDEDETDED